MPRTFDSDDPAGAGPLVFEELVDCPQCDTTFTGQFADDSDTVQDVTEAPQGIQTCPACGYEWVALLSGWTFFTEAG